MVMSAKDHQKMVPVMSLIKKWADSRAIPYDMLYRQVWQESRGNPRALGDSGNSFGLMQINRNSAGKDMKADISRLYDPDYNLNIGTAYLMRIRSQLLHLLPKETKEAWSIIFMAYNSGIGYAKKALERIRNRGDNLPTLKKVLEEMQKKDFGRTPIYAVTVPYATFVSSGREMTLREILGGQASQIMAQVPFSSPVIQSAGKNLLVPVLLLGLGYLAYKNRRTIFA